MDECRASTKNKLLSFYGRESVSFVFILLIGLILRLYRIGAYDYWYDEVQMLFRAEWIISSAAMHSLFKHFSFLPFLCEFIIALGKGLQLPDISYRYMSVFFSMIAMVFSYKLIVRLSSKTDALLVMLLMAISPFQVMYAQEVGQYALFNCLSAISFYYLFKYYEWEGGRKDVLFYVLSAIAMVYSHYFGIYVLCLQQIFVFVARHRRRRAFAVLVLAVFVLAMAPFFRGLQALYGDISLKYDWMFSPTIRTILRTYLHLMYGFNFNTYLVATMSYFAAVCLLVPGVFMGMKGRPQRECVFLFALGSHLLVWIAAVFFYKNFYLHRYFCFMAPFLFLMLVQGRHFYSSYLKGVLLGLVLICMACSLRNYYENVYPLYPYRIGIVQKKEVKKAAAYIQERKQEGDRVLLYHDSVSWAFLYYNGSIGNVDKIRYGCERYARSFYLKDFIDIVVGPREFGIDVSQDNADLKAKVYHALEGRYGSQARGRLWFVSGAWTAEESIEFAHFISEYFSERGAVVDKKDFAGVSVCLYQWEDGVRR